MRVAVIGGGIAGLAAAFELSKAGAEVVMYEKEDRVGGHARTVTVDGIDVDIGVMVFNRVTYPNAIEMFEKVGAEMEISEMSFSVSLDGGKGCEWGSHNGLASLFAQKSNLLNPYFWLMLHEIRKFKGDTLRYLTEHEENPDLDRSGTLGQFIKSRGYSMLFQKAYLIPICASIWSCPFEVAIDFSAYSILSFFCNHHLLQLFDRPQWLTFKHRSQDYVNKLREELEGRGCQIKVGCAVQLVSSTDYGCSVLTSNGLEEYDECVISTHAPDAVKVLGEQISFDEMRVLGSFQYFYSDIYLHRDISLMPQNQSTWSAWNFLGTTENGVCLTYWLNVLQNLEFTFEPFLVTLNPPFTPKHKVLKWRTGHPVPSVAALKASVELGKIQGKRKIWFCGAYQGYGFHEDGLKSGSIVACNILGKELKLLKNPRHMILSLTEAGARMVVAKFLKRFIKIGALTFHEEGGTTFDFEGVNKGTHVRSVLKVHDPLFYWKIATEADIGLADAYISGYFSFVDEKYGLLKLFLLLIANRDLKNSFNNNQNNRGWWTPLLLTAGVASVWHFIQHNSRKNNLFEARLNISRHYDLDKIRLLLCDYRELTTSQKYDRIISCEMIEAVGHEYMGQFFHCCDELLAVHGVVVLQCISIPDQRYQEYRRSSDFIKKYMFPGGCLPSLSSITSAMTASSKLCIEHVENIGIHYYQTLMYWRRNFMANKPKILALGFDDRFIRMWDYYFNYCAAGFKSLTLGTYQIVFTRPGNTNAFSNPYEGVCVSPSKVRRLVNQ